MTQEEAWQIVCFGCGYVFDPSDGHMRRPYQITELAKKGIENTLCEDCSTHFRAITPRGWDAVARLVEIYTARGFYEATHS